MARPALDALGYFYAIQLEPERQPTRFKLGWASVLERRLAQHQRERKRPDARIVASWPCRFGWEQTIIAEATRAQCLNVRGEEFLTDDPEVLLASLEGYFAQNDACSDEFPVDLLRQAFKFRQPRSKKRRQRVAGEGGFFLVPEVAERFGVHVETVRLWLRSGRLRGTLLMSKQAGYRIPASEVERLLTGQPPAD
jgi:excisionase family DNA binding protein